MKSKFSLFIFFIINIVTDIQSTFIDIDFPTNGQTVSNSRPTITGTMEVNNTIVTVSIDGGASQNATIINSFGGNWSFVPSTPLVQGAHTIQAFTQDPNGNTASTPIINFTIDSPTFVTISIPSSGVTLGAGLLSLSPVISGTMEPGNTVVTVSIDGGPSQNATVVDSSFGFWAFIVGSEYSGANHTIQATTRDPNSNVAITSITMHAPSEEIGLDLRLPSSGSIINNNQPTISGENNEDLTVQVSIDGTSIGNTTTSSNFLWSLPTPSHLANGEHTIFASTKDSNGNFANATSVITVNNAVPPLTISSPTNGIQTLKNPAIVGSTNPGLIVTVSIDGTSIGSTTANETGSWIISLPTPLSAGSHVMLASTQDALGNKALAVSTFNVLGINNNIKIVSPANESIINDNKPQIIGTAFRGMIINVSIDNVFVGSATTSSLGDWQLTITSALSEGNHIILAENKDPELEIVDSAASQFNVNTQAPLLLIVSPSNGTIITNNLSCDL